MKNHKILLVTFKSRTKAKRHTYQWNKSQYLKKTIEGGEKGKLNLSKRK